MTKQYKKQSLLQKIITIALRGTALTRNQFRQITHPERLENGLEQFNIAFNKLIVGGFLIECGKTQRAKKYLFAEAPRV